MGIFSVIDNQELWNRSLQIVDNADPCHGFSFHKIYELHQNANSIKLLEYRNDEEFVKYPMLIFDVPKEISNEGYKYSTSPYGFTGPLIRGSKKFINKAFKYIDKWFFQEKIFAEFVRFSPFLDYDVSKLNKNNYAISKNRFLAIWDISLIDMQNCSPKYDCNMSRRARKSGVIFREIKKVDLDQFQDLYNATMIINKAENFFFYSKDYFQKLCEEGSSHNNYIYGVFKEDILIAAAWFLELNNIAVYHLGCNNRQIPGISNLVLREAIRDLVENKNVSKINLTGGRTKDIEDKLLKFKASIANSQKDFYIGTRTIMPDIYKKLSLKYYNLYPENSSCKFIPWS